MPAVGVYPTHPLPACNHDGALVELHPFRHRSVKKVSLFSDAAEEASPTPTAHFRVLEVKHCTFPAALPTLLSALVSALLKRGLFMTDFGSVRKVEGVCQITSGI